MNTLKRVSTLAKRFWRIYVQPPKETGIFLPVSKLPVMTEKIALTETKSEPKQVAVDHHRRLAFVSCMKGKVVQAFDYSEGKLELVREWRFDEQCVEVEVRGDTLFITTTNFARGPRQSSHLVVVDIASGETLSSVDTGGEWSKVVKVHPHGYTAFVSNWHSHNVSVIDVGDPCKPRLRQIIPCGEAPRGIDFTPDGGCLVTGYYSAQIYTLKESEGRWAVGAESERFDPQGYGGNLRDVVVAPAGHWAWVSNMGRNLVHRFDIQRGEITDSVVVGRFPNTVRFLDTAGKTLLVSCRKEGTVCFVDTEKLEVVGRSPETGRSPTGLAIISDGFLVTNFADNTLEYHHLKTTLR